MGCIQVDLTSESFLEINEFFPLFGLQFRDMYGFRIFHLKLYFAIFCPLS